jgi:hypothetical protein
MSPGFFGAPPSLLRHLIKIKLIPYNLFYQNDLLGLFILWEKGIESDMCWKSLLDVTWKEGHREDDSFCYQTHSGGKGCCCVSVQMGKSLETISTIQNGLIGVCCCSYVMRS